MTPDVTVSARQRRCIAALLLTGSVSKAALEVGRSRETVYRWFKLPPFREVLAAAEAESLLGLSATLLGLSHQAVIALERILGDEPELLGDVKEENLRMRAAEIVLTNLLRLSELYTVEARLSKLEEYAKSID